MSLIQRIKSVLGLNGSAPRDEEGPVAVTVEHEPEPATEAGDVEETPPEMEPAEPTTGTGEVEEAPAETEWPDPDTETETEETLPETEPADAEPDGPTHDGPVTEISGIGPSYSERLAAAGVDTVGELARADADELGEATDLSPKRISGWIESARDLASGN